MRTKRAVARELMAELKETYREASTLQPIGDDYDAIAQAFGRYDGLKRAYILLTGCSAQDVGNEVVAWYIRTPEYQAEKVREAPSTG